MQFASTCDTCHSKNALWQRLWHEAFVVCVVSALVIRAYHWMRFGSISKRCHSQYAFYQRLWYQNAFWQCLWFVSLTKWDFAQLVIWLFRSKSGLLAKRCTVPDFMLRSFHVYLFFFFLGNRRWGRTESLPCLEGSGRRDRRNSYSTSTPIPADSEHNRRWEEFNHCVSSADGNVPRFQCISRQVVQNHRWSSLRWDSSTA